MRITTMSPRGVATWIACDLIEGCEKVRLHVGDCGPIHVEYDVTVLRSAGARGRSTMTLEDRVQTALTAIIEIVPAPLLSDGEDNLRGVLLDLVGVTDGSFTVSAPWHRQNRYGDKCISCQRPWPCPKVHIAEMRHDR